MAEAIYTQIVAAVRTRLRTIVADAGATYWYTPSLVEEFPALTDEEVLQKCAGLGSSPSAPATVYIISPGLEEKSPATMGTSGKRKGRMMLDVSAAQRFTAATENPVEPPSPSRITVQSRMIRDIEKALLADQTSAAANLGMAEVTDVEVTAADRTAENTWQKGWALAFLRVEILYHYPVGTP